VNETKTCVSACSHFTSSAFFFFLYVSLLYVLLLLYYSSMHGCFVGVLSTTLVMKFAWANESMEPWRKDEIVSFCIKRHYITWLFIMWPLETKVRRVLCCSKWQGSREENRSQGVQRKPNLKGFLLETMASRRERSIGVILAVSAFGLCWAVPTNLKAYPSKLVHGCLIKCIQHCNLCIYFI
jgi:hypothetical protein